MTNEKSIRLKLIQKNTFQLKNNNVMKVTDPLKSLSFLKR